MTDSCHQFSSFTSELCTTIWSFCSKITLMKAERCQTFATKIISDSHHKKHNWFTPFRNALGMLTFEKLCKLRFACYIFKIVNKIFPHWYIYLPLVIETREIHTRQDRDLFVPNLQKLLSKRVLYYSAPTL